MAAALDDDHNFVRAELSPRETEVLALYAAGMTAEMVASELYIARSTVVDHIRNIRAKYIALGRNVTGKVNLLQRAQEDGLA